MTVAEAAIEVMRAVGARSLNWGDEDLCAKIAARMSWPCNGIKTSDRVLYDLRKHPGELVVRITKVRGSRRHHFWLPECAPEEKQLCLLKTT